jgi:transcriptional regulator of arginine metabolism
MSRTKRQTIIKRLVTENDIHTQQELLELLAKENIVTTQATVSRDIRELNIDKINSGDDHCYYRVLNHSALGSKVKTDEERLVDIISETGVALTQIEFTNLLTVLPGNGQSIGVLIDRIRVHHNQIAGCIAGDDTILILSKNREDANYVHRYFQQYLYNSYE